MEPLSTTIAGTIAKELIPKGIELVRHILKPTTFRLSVSEANLESALDVHLDRIFTWSQMLEGLNLDDSKLVSHSYIDLEYFLTAKETHYSEQKPEVKLVDTIFEKTDKHIAILGEAGMGKTSSMKKITYKWLTEEDYLKLHSMPLVILFRDLPIPADPDYKAYYLTRHIQHELGIFISAINPGSKEEQNLPDALLSKCVWKYLETHKFLLLLDGFDEIPSWMQRSIYRELDAMSTYLSETRIVLTSRTASFSYSPTNIRLFEISPFNNEQIISFSRRWLGEEKGKAFFEEVDKSIFREMAGRPLILSYLTMLFSINKRIPELPKSLYQQVVLILIQKWDRVRGLSRQSQFESFDYDNKIDFLSHLSYELLVENKVAFSQTDLQTAYIKIAQYFPNLPPGKSDAIISEIRQHSGLIVVGGFDSFQFAHKSIQEYFAGNFISKYHPLDAIKHVIAVMPYECSMATMLTSNPSGFFMGIVAMMDRESGKKDLSAYLARVVELKPIFPISAQFGFCILDLWESQYDNNFQGFLQLLELKGVKESIAKLNEYYKPDHGKLADKDFVPHSMATVRISRRNVKDKDQFPKFTLSVPLVAIKDWKHIRI